MSKGLEALGKISWRFPIDPDFQEWCNTIEKDLERLEVLELNLDSEKYRLVNENQCLKNRVEDLEISFKEQIKENKDLKENIEVLKKEKEQLEQDVKDVMADYQDAARLMFKFDRVIEILKNKRVDLGVFMNCKSLEEYNDSMEYTYKSISGNYKLDEKEYSLLSEGLIECQS